MKINRSEIMKEAWKLYKGFSRNLRGEVQGTFSAALRLAWANAKRKAAQTVESMEEELFILRMKDHWNAGDFQRAAQLKEAISAAA